MSRIRSNPPSSVVEVEVVAEDAPGVLEHHGVAQRADAAAASEDLHADTETMERLAELEADHARAEDRH